MHIQVSPESLQAFARCLQREADGLETWRQRLAKEMSTLDWQVRGGADVELNWQIAQKQMMALTLEMERFSHRLRQTAAAFESADRHCLNDYVRLSNRLRTRFDLWQNGSAENFLKRSHQDSPEGDS